MPSTAELRRRWSAGTEEAFSQAHRCGEYVEYPAADYERKFDFRGCKSIAFIVGSGSRADLLMSTQGSGQMDLPAGVSVHVKEGFAKFRSCGEDEYTDAQSTVGGSGIRAPPPSRVSYADSRAGSSFDRRSPPRDGASFRSGGSSYEDSRSYVSARSARQVPLPRSNAGSRYDDDNDSIAPSESISSVGSRGQRSTYSRTQSQTQSRYSGYARDDYH